MFDFTDQVVIVTGAAGALGSTVARAFHQAGAHMSLVDLRQERLAEVFPELVDDDQCLITGVNLTDEEDVARMAGETMGKFGRIDVLVNVAGGFKQGPKLHETELKTWQFMMNLNALSVFLASRAVAPHMLGQGSGKIVNIAARAALKGEAEMGPYIASKSAVIRLTETLSEELKHDGVNVNCILPGTIDTEQNRESMPNADYERWVPPAALADVILFLASDAARAVQGAAVPVYGRS